MLSFRNFFMAVGSGEGACPSQVMVIKLKIKEMHFNNVSVDHWGHTFYKKILYMFTLLIDCTSLLNRFYCYLQFVWYGWQ